MDPDMLTVNINLCDPNADREALLRIEQKLDSLLQKENTIMADLTALTAEVQRNTECGSVRFGSYPGARTAVRKTLAN